MASENTIRIQKQKRKLAAKAAPVPMSQHEGTNRKERRQIMKDAGVFKKPKKTLW